jgi:hypothetical protein
MSLGVLAFCLAGLDGQILQRWGRGRGPRNALQVTRGMRRYEKRPATQSWKIPAF